MKDETMKRIVNAFIAIAATFTMLTSVCPASAIAEELNALNTTNQTTEPTIETIDINAAEDFSYETWSDPINPATADGEEVSDAAETVKTKVLAAYDECANSVTFNYSDGITVADVRAGMTLVYTNAEYYWAASCYSMSYYDADGDQEPDDTEIAGYLALYYVVDTANITTIKAETEAKIAEALSWVDADNMTAFQAAQALHDYIVRNCVYSISATSSTMPTTAHTAYGVLVENSAVCQGYALAYKLLLGRLGIPVVFVASTSMNHAWNMIQIDDNWYHVDATWDDPVYADGTDTGFDAEVSHDYFLLSDATMKKLGHYGWEAAYTTPANDYSNRTYAEYKGPITPEDTGSQGSTTTRTHTYDNSATATSNGITFKVEWDDATTKGKATTFHVTQTGGSSTAQVRMDVPQYWDNDSQESVCDPSRDAWGSYATIGDGYDYTFEFTASGTYRCLFYFMDSENNIYYLRTTANVTVNDTNRPSVTQIVNNAVAQAKKETDGSDYNMALWLHDWTLDQLEYDYDLNWCSAESGLTRGKGTCESYQRIYAKLLNAADISNGRVEGNGHTWNAVKIDGKWCQMDLTWDDSSDNWYDDFDQRHIYFGLTDELMAIAHSDHAATYQTDGYAYRSTDLSNNYFVRNGKADEWADAYTERIQQHLNTKETSFSIDADNATYPPGICGIQNGIIADRMNQRNWTASDGAEATLTATSNVTTKSSTEWTAKYDFAVTYQNKPNYTVYYHQTIASSAAPQTTQVIYGKSTPTLATSDLNFSNGSSTFLGWKAYRDNDNKWWVTLPNGKGGWVETINGKLPDGCTYRLLPDGWKTGWSAQSGSVHLYGTWKNSYIIQYHTSVVSSAAPQTTQVIYGKSTPTLATSDLNFSNGSSTFLGWKAYRDNDNKWWVTLPNGKGGWVETINGKLPDGCTYRLLPDGWKTGWSAQSGSVHLYGTWK